MRDYFGLVYPLNNLNSGAITSGATASGATVDLSDGNFEALVVVAKVEAVASGVSIGCELYGRDDPADPWVAVESDFVVGEILIEADSVVGSMPRLSYVGDKQYIQPRFVNGGTGAGTISAAAILAQPRHAPAGQS